jgi:hypothetical protein
MTITSITGMVTAGTSALSDRLYAVAFRERLFWTFLEGDERHEHYLTPGYAKRNELKAIVF